MSSSSVAKPYFDESGLIMPLEEEIFNAVRDDYNAAFGGNLNLNLETPQGQLISSTTAIIADANNVFAELVNQVDPDTADGIMQDAIGRIYFLQRHAATASSVTCVCTGVPGTLIAAGALASDSAGNIYRSLEDKTIEGNGSVQVTFQNEQTGPIVCPAGSVSQIYRAVIGWDSVYNPLPGVLGTSVENRMAFERRRRQSVALNAIGSLPSIYAAVSQLDGVMDVYVTENNTSQPITVGSTNYQLKPHSLYVAVLGGSSAEIAETIWQRKNVGCNYNGDTMVAVEDKSYEAPPFPQYQVFFQRPDERVIRFKVQIALNTALPHNIDALIKQAIINAFSGGDGGLRARIGGSILASRFYGPISAIDPRLEIIAIQIGLNNPNANLVNMGIDQIPVVDASQITVVQV